MRARTCAVSKRSGRGFGASKLLPPSLRAEHGEPSGIEAAMAGHSSQRGPGQKLPVSDCIQTKNTQSLPGRVETIEADFLVAALAHLAARGPEGWAALLKRAQAWSKSSKGLSTSKGLKSKSWSRAKARPCQKWQSPAPASCSRGAPSACVADSLRTTKWLSVDTSKCLSRSDNPKVLQWRLPKGHEITAFRVSSLGAGEAA